MAELFVVDNARLEAILRVPTVPGASFSFLDNLRGVFGKVGDMVGHMVLV